MKLTKKEKELILKLREEEQKNMLKFQGTLKHDLCFFPQMDHMNRIILCAPCYWMTANQRRELVQNLISSFITIPRGIEFSCVISDGEKLWSDCAGYGLEEMDDQWANANLENIRDL